MPTIAIDHPVLHQMTAVLSAITVCGHRYEFPRGQRSALIARPGLVNPNVNLQATIVRQIDRRRRGSPIDSGKPAGVAMGQELTARLAAS